MKAYKLTGKMYATFLVFILIACSDDILDKTPLDQYSDATLWAEVDLADAYLMNVYSGIGSGFNGEMLSSLAAETLVARGPNGTDYLKGLTTPDNTRGPHLARYEWGLNFKQIQITNVFLDNIDKVSEFYEGVEQVSVKSRTDVMKGEGLFLRAWYYHQLLRAYGGLPLLSQASQLGDDFNAITRATFEETVNFIVADLDAASALLKLKSEMEMGRATKEAALALKSRVLLFAASDLTADGTAESELVGYRSPDRTALWRAAQDAAKAVMDLNTARLADFGAPDLEAVANNYYELFRSYDLSSEEIIWGRMFLRNVGFTHNHNRTSGPNGNSNFGRNGPVQGMVDSYEMKDGSKFSDHFMVDGQGYYKNNSETFASENIYHNREPRFYASILFDSAVWQPRLENLQDRDPLGIYQTRTVRTMRADGTWTNTFGIDTHNGPVDDWNANYARYVMKKFMDHTSIGMVENNMNVWIELRYAEVVLNYAEASMELGDIAAASTHINMIRSRTGLPDFTGDITEALRHERKVELAFEEIAWFDIRRWKILEERLSPEISSAGIDILETRHLDGTVTTTWQQINAQMLNNVVEGNMKWIPIARAETNRAPQLVQNPPWNQ
jgi:hypothetical protein